VKNLSTISIALVAALATGLIGVRAEDKPADDTQKPLALGQERIPAGEDEVIKNLVALQLAIMKNTDPTKRGQHAKGHGCVEAEFAVRGDIPKEYQLGIFKEAKTYKAKIRFSNGLQMDDTKPDVRGMAVKVMGVKGTRARENEKRDDQDFLLVDSEVFFAPDAKTFLDFLTANVAAVKDPEAMKKFGTKNPRTMELLPSFLKAAPASPLAIQYWSTVPFKLGDGAVKYTAKPSPGNAPKEAKPMTENGLRAAMVDHLTKGKKTAEFELCIIPQTDAAKMPVEDATVRWDSKPIPVATIMIEPQTFDTPEKLKECEEASFDVWNALAAHQPLGGINRARKAVYPASVNLRDSGTPK
jgi:catalase